jgi:hypothetical protein
VDDILEGAKLRFSSSLFIFPGLKPGSNSVSLLGIDDTDSKPAVFKFGIGGCGMRFRTLRLLNVHPLCNINRCVMN